MQSTTKSKKRNKNGYILDNNMVTQKWYIKLFEKKNIYIYIILEYKKKKKNLLMILIHEWPIIKLKLNQFNLIFLI